MEREPGDRALGALMVAAAAATFVAMGHHPSSAHDGALARGVHGMMIAAVILLTAGFLHLARRLGLARPEVSIGLVAYLLAVAAGVGAATINGFVVPALTGGAGPAVGHDLFRFAWEANQALARIGVYATGAAYVLWGSVLARQPGLQARGIGAIGVLVGAGSAALLGLGAVRMNVGGAFLVYAAHGLWAALVGIQLYRGRLI